MKQICFYGKGIVQHTKMQFAKIVHNSNFSIQLSEIQTI